MKFETTSRAGRYVFGDMPRSRLEQSIQRLWRVLAVRRFLTTTLLYFAVCAAGWCSLAGAGFILMLAFMSDSSPGPGKYAQGVLELAMVIFVYPLAGFLVLSAVVAAVHLSIRAVLINRFGRAAPDRATPQAAEPSGASASPSRADSRPAPRFPFLILGLCTVSMMLGTAIIVGNVPRGLARDGLVPTVVTGLVFFVPLVLLPSVVLLRTLRAHARRIRSHASSHTRTP